LCRVTQHMWHWHTDTGVGVGVGGETA
jgi:hypothetical protein